MEEHHTRASEYGLFVASNDQQIEGHRRQQNNDNIKGIPRKMERRRTETMNLAFANLREHIPNVPTDTKLSKIKTLRLAISYIRYLREVLDGEDPGEYVVDLHRDRSIAMDIANHYDHKEKQKKEVVMDVYFTIYAKNMGV